MTNAPEQCPQVESLYALAESALEQPDLQQIRSHVNECAVCRQVLLDAVHMKYISGALARFRANQRDVDRIERWTGVALESLANTLQAKRGPDLLST